ncbi:MAG: hypothetical protein LBB21_02665 [Holosporaceae bacterium]|jgi:hypothetical protein|nr:hypothetical protein [Holosporaceae bacterium]
MNKVLIFEFVIVFFFGWCTGDMLRNIMKTIHSRKNVDKPASLQSKQISRSCNIADPHILNTMKYFILSNDENGICACSATSLQDADPKGLA